jgi:hypothetical protein
MPLSILLLLCEISDGRAPRTQTTVVPKRALVTIFFPAANLRALNVILPEKKCIQNYVLVILITELSHANTPGYNSNNTSVRPGITDDVSNWYCLDSQSNPLQCP